MTPAQPIARQRVRGEGIDDEMKQNAESGEQRGHSQRAAAQREEIDDVQIISQEKFAKDLAVMSLEQIGVVLIEPQRDVIERGVLPPVRARARVDALVAAAEKFSPAL